ncbi:methyltransferase domain-containing protein [Microbulbifer bruguierae]|uniref:Methyltransferase domain-containing protein n=1 Tax=Microbulbifer bruguierae TaxID=3029061 RepID=A0ABY8NEG5_9GAMM|nr:methyltransferase domain-containing protein [Microbulbifer bruguierae]WGL17311.1 methyltransferase domain-containing protein [Microbulbifer bruguierae]
MALIWHKQVGTSRYEVRTHGASVRLYSNGVFHSQWNPIDPLKGSLWELLLLPAFFLPAGEVQRVLILGVGGGALIRLLQRYIGPGHITGVDIDPHHLTVARRYFGVRGVNLVCADAREYIDRLNAQSEYEPFDLVVDDLFGHCDGVAERGVEAELSWCEGLLDLLAPGGIVVGNFGSRQELLSSGWRSPVMRGRLSGRWTAELAAYENCIGVFSRKPLARSVLTDQAPHLINPANPARRLDPRLRPLR